jgi:hypothetical protein
MKAKILFLMLFITCGIYSQGVLTPVDKLKIKYPASMPTATEVVVRQSNGEIGTILKTDLVDIVEAVSASMLPATGTISKVYITLDDNKLYRWSGVAYVLVSAIDISGKADIASPTFTGTVGGITNTMVGLGNVDNTSDANKPVSTAAQTALATKWSITGNSGTNSSTNFIGTSDNTDLVIKRNSTPAISIGAANIALNNPNSNYSSGYNVSMFQGTNLLHRLNVLYSGDSYYADQEFYYKNGASYITQGKFSVFSNSYINTIGGNFGIGTKMPSEKFEVVGNAKATAFIKSGGTSSQFLKADGSVDSATYQTTLTNPITGTGTANYLSKFTGLGTLGNSSIYEDAAGLVLTKDNFTSQDGGLWMKGISYHTGIRSVNSGNDIALVTNDIVNVTVKENGNVGIGTTTPAQKLTVEGNIGLRSGSALVLNTPSNNDSAAINYDSDYKLNISSPSGKLDLYGFSGVNLGSNATPNAVKILENGNMGVGTANPVTKQHIFGNGVIESAFVLQNGNYNNSTSGVGGMVLSQADNGDFNIGRYGEAELVTIAHDRTLATKGDISINNFGGYGSLFFDGQQADKKQYQLLNAIYGVSNTGFSIRNTTDGVNMLSFNGANHATFSNDLSVGGNIVGSSSIYLGSEKAIQFDLGTSNDYYALKTGSSLAFGSAGNFTFNKYLNISNGYSAPDSDAGYRLKFSDNGGIYNDTGIGVSGEIGSQVQWYNSIGGHKWYNGTAGEKMILTNDELQVNGTVSASNGTLIGGVGLMVNTIPFLSSPNTLDNSSISYDQNGNLLFNTDLSTFSGNVVSEWAFLGNSSYEIGKGISFLNSNRDNVVDISYDAPTDKLVISNDIDVSGTISASPATASNQVVVKGQLDLKSNLMSPALIGTPTAPTATAGTSTTQIATTAFVQETKKITVRKISTATTLADSDNGKVILLTGSCTVTLPNGLMNGFNVSFATQAGATLTYSLGGSVTLINNTGTVMGEMSSHTLVNTGTTNEYLTVGL